MDLLANTHAATVVLAVLAVVPALSAIAHIIYIIMLAPDLARLVLVFLGVVV